jgi:hypothetical protein
MKQLLSSCLAVGALAGATLAHPTLATASEPVWLTEAEMDRVTAGFELGFQWNGTIVGSWTKTLETLLPNGGTIVTSTTISCIPGCETSISINQSGSSSIATAIATSGP